MTDSILPSLQRCIDELGRTNSNLDKVAVLQQFPDLEPILTAIMDKHKKTRVTRSTLLAYKQKKFPRLKDRKTLFPSDVSTMLDWLVEGKVSGDDAKELVWTVVERHPKYEELILRVADKDLKTRLGQAMLQKAFGSSETEYSPALAFDIEKKMDYFQTSVQAGQQWFISRKLDGCRVQVHTTHPVVSKSRAGNVFKSLVHLNQLVSKYVPQGWVLDAECCVINPDGSESFSEAVSAIKRSEPMLRFHCIVFDILTKEEFESGTSMQTLSERFQRASAVLGAVTKHGTVHQRVSWLLQVPYTPEVFQEWQDTAESSGWEGIMTRRDVPYEGKRTKNLLKVKKFHTEEYEIVGLKTGPFRMIDSKTGLEKEIETVTAVNILHKGFPVSVGSGFSVDQRQEMYLHPDRFLGKIIAVQYFEETKSSNGGLSLRFPTFKGMYGSKRNV